MKLGELLKFVEDSWVEVGIVNLETDLIDDIETNVYDDRSYDDYEVEFFTGGADRNGENLISIVLKPKTAE